MNNICTFAKVEKCYPYRTSCVKAVDAFLILDWHSEPMKELAENLREATGQSFCDNHTGYKVLNREGRELYIYFSDGKVWFADRLEEGEF